MNQEQRMNEVASEVMDLLEGHEESADIIILLLKVRNRGEGAKFPAPQYEDLIAPIESVLDASGLEPVEIDRLLNRVYSTFMDC